MPGPVLRFRGVAVLAVLAASVSGCAGGFELDAGDVAVIRVAYAEASLSDGCYPDGTPPTDDGDETNLRAGQTILVYGSAEGDAEPTYYLDAGGLVLAGTAGEDGVYSFTGQDKDVQAVDTQFITDADHDGQDDFSVDGMVDANNNGVDDDEEAEIDADGDGLEDRFEDDFVDTNGDGMDDYEPIQLPSDTKLVQTTKYAVSMAVTDDGVTGTYESTTSVKCDGPSCATFEGQECRSTTTFVGVWVEDAEVDVALGGAPTGGAPAPGGS